MFNSIKSANCNHIWPTNKHKSMTKGNHYHQHQSHINHNNQHHNHNQSKQSTSTTISLNIHDTNDIRYSKSNTQLQLTRLSLSASLIDIYFGKHYRSPDVLVVAGFILILIGLGAILIGVYVYFNEDEFQEMTFFVGCAMAAIGFICCSCRIIFFGPPLFNCCLTIKSSPTNNNYHNQRRPTNPPFYTATSQAMSTVTCIGVRFNSSQSKSTVSNVNQTRNQMERKIDSPSKSLNDLSITSIHGDSLESIETIKDETNQLDHNQSIDPSVLQFISKLGSKT